MKFYNATAIKKGEDIVLQYWDFPMPKWLPQEGQPDFEDATNKYNAWLSSKKEVMFHKDSVDEFKKMISWNDIYPTALLTGIRVPESIVDRIYLKCDYCGYISKDKNHAHDFACPPPGPKYYSHLKTLPLVEDESQEETQEDWEIAFKDADKFAMFQDQKDREENNIQESGYMFWFKLHLKRKFHLTRK